MMAAIDLIRDPYQRQARVVPGLLVALPLLIPLVCVYGPKNPILTAVVGLLGSCGAIYALASVARGLGKRLEDRLKREWGGMPTTLMLRHGDPFLDRVTKERYHALMTTKLGIIAPTAAAEAADPRAADEIYMGATRRLIERTRGDRGLLFKENVAYGFHRNMTAVKPLGLVSCAFGIAYGLVIAGVIQHSPLGWAWEHLLNPGLAAGVTLLVSVTLAAAWVLYFTRDAVRRIGFAYGERLFERLPALTALRKEARRSS